MTKNTKQGIILLFKKLSKKGYFSLLLHISSNEAIHYNDVLKHAITNKIVKSRASITIILNDLTDLGILDRTVSQDRPIRTTYKVSNKGKIVIKHLKELESIF